MSGLIGCGMYGLLFQTGSSAVSELEKRRDSSLEEGPLMWYAAFRDSIRMAVLLYKDTLSGPIAGLSSHQI